MTETISWWIFLVGFACVFLFAYTMAEDLIRRPADNFFFETEIFSSKISA